MERFYKRALWALIILSITCGIASAQQDSMPARISGSPLERHSA